MGSTVKSKSVEIYSLLLHFYPQSFRRKYALTMEQTFDDMLEDQSTKLGRWGVWARTLRDMPLSASREHLTNGKEVQMNRYTKLILISVIAAVIIVGAGSYLLGSQRARQSIGIERVSVAQMADAMQNDSFYSSYGGAGLLFSGKVASVTKNSNVTLVAFSTNRPYGVTCQFPENISAKVGATLSVAAPGGSAERLTNGVLLHNCLLN